MSRLNTVLESSDSQQASHSPKTQVNRIHLNGQKLSRDFDDLVAWLKSYNLDSPLGKLSVKQWLSHQIAKIDDILNDQLNSILHHSKLQKLEASWSGLWVLIDSSNSSRDVKIKLLDLSWKELSKDMERAPDFEQSALFDIIYNREFGIPGGEPYGVLIGDYEVAHKPFEGHRHDDVYTLQGIAHVAGAAFAPFICAAAPQLFGLDDFDNLSSTLNLDEIFRHPEYIRWNTLRELEDTRFIALTLPKVLMRKPYKPELSSINSLYFNEEARESRDHYLWGNASFAMGAVLIREFNQVGWFSHIRGAPRDHMGGGLVTHFPSLPYDSDTSESLQKITTRVLITDTLERELNNHGLISLCHCYLTPYAAFHSCPSLQKPKSYSNKAANANARISAMMQQILCASRFAHYIKVMVRDKIGSYKSANDCERFLQKWLNQYTTGRDDLSWEMMARYPLREARVQINDEPGKAGTYQCLIHLKSHYTVDHLISEIKLASSLNQAGFGNVV